MMLVDGKRTFAIGMLANCSESDAAEFKRVGVNYVMFGGPTMGRQADLWPLFDAMYDAGVYVVGGVSPQPDHFIDLIDWPASSYGLYGTFV